MLSCCVTLGAWHDGLHQFKVKIGIEQHFSRTATVLHARRSYTVDDGDTLGNMHELLLESWVFRQKEKPCPERNQFWYGRDLTKAPRPALSLVQNGSNASRLQIA